MLVFLTPSVPITSSAYWNTTFPTQFVLGVAVAEVDVLWAAEYTHGFFVLVFQV